MKIYKDSDAVSQNQYFVTGTIMCGPAKNVYRVRVSLCVMRYKSINTVSKTKTAVVLHNVDHSHC